MPGYKTKDSLGYKGWNVHPKGAKSSNSADALDKHRGSKRSVRVK